MDPLSVAAGIAGLISLCGETVKLARRYLEGVKHARTSAAALLRELEALSSSLKQLKEFVDGESTEDKRFEPASFLDNMMNACTVTLDDLYPKLKKVADGGSQRSRLGWPLRESEHEKAVQELRNLGQWIQLGVTLDGYQILWKTSDDVVRTLAQQLKNFESLNELDKRTKSIESVVRATGDSIRDDKLKQRREAILNWISDMDHEETHLALKKPRVSGTGGWLLEHKAFLAWRDEEESPQIIWCHGKPGSGKSLLASTVIDHLRDRMLESKSMSVLFLYFDYRKQDRQSPERTMSSFLKQLVASLDGVPDGVSQAYDKIGGQSLRAELDKLKSIVLESLRTSESKVFIVVDALDECDENLHRGPFISCLKSILSCSNTRLFMTSRSHPNDIASFVSNAPKIRVEAQETDLRQYLNYTIEVSEAAECIDEKFQKTIVDRITESAHGMFLLPKLQIEAILRELTPGDMEDALHDMPQTLPAAFEDTITRIKQQEGSRGKFALKILMCLCYAKQPMSVGQLREALAVREGATSLDLRYAPLLKFMVSCCLGLVTVDEKTTAIGLVHYSAQQYLSGRGQDLFGSAEQKLAEICITYLSFDEFATGPRKSKRGIIYLVKRYDFLPYAATCWGKHVKMANSTDTDQKVLSFLRSQGSRALAYQIHRFIVGYRKEYWNSEEANSTPAIVLAARFGLINVVRQLLDNKQAGVNDATKAGSTSLIQAASSGHLKLVKLLLSRGADPTMSNWYGTSLHCAAEAGQCDTMAAILDSGMDVDFKLESNVSPIYCALARNKPAAVKLLLDRKSKTTVADLYRQLCANRRLLSSDYDELLAVLICREGSLEAKTINGYTLLHLAVLSDHLWVVKILMIFGANADVKDDSGKSARDYAVEKNQAKLLEALNKDYPSPRPKLPPFT